jgi:hypothetical protein
MKFSLINVQRRGTGTIDGNWIQDHIGTFESATQVAIETEAVNGNKIDVAVVDDSGTFKSTGQMCYFLKRLDTQRI